MNKLFQAGKLRPLIDGPYKLSEVPKAIQYFGEGQLKKDDPQAYYSYSLVPATLILEAISRFRSLPKIKALEGATIQKLNSLNAGIRYQVQKHFQATGIIPCLEGESQISIQNLRAAYGSVATHFFCPSLPQFPRFLSSKLGHLIGDELIDRPTSISTSHYFHYYLVDENGDRLDSLGVKLSESQSSLSPSKSRHAVLNIKSDTKQLFKQKQQAMGTETENDTLLQLIKQSNQVPSLLAQLAESQQQIERLQTKLVHPEASSSSKQEQAISTADSDTTDSLDNQSTKPISTDLTTTVSTEPEQLLPTEFSPSEPETPPLIEAISSLVHSMSLLTSKFDLFLTQSLPVNHPQTTTSNSPSSPKPKSKPKSTPSKVSTKSSDKTKALINRVIDLIIQHNQQQSKPSDMWFISQKLMKQVSSSQHSISKVFQLRQSELDQHHSDLGIGSYHNRSHHQGHQLKDFFDF